MITLEEGREAYQLLRRSEKEVVNLLAEGRLVKEIAAIRCVEQNTVRTQIKRALFVFGLHSQLELISIIWRIRYDDLMSGVRALMDDPWEARNHGELARYQEGFVRRGAVGYGRCVKVSDLEEVMP